jgi:hypothetical protein
MARFFFDVREDGDFIRDDEGLLLASINAAEREAAEAAAAIGRDLLPAGSFRSVTVEVRDENYNKLLSAIVTLDIRRYGASMPATKRNDQSNRSGRP